eukprot:TRINITY_DN17234_c0_g1_i1.p1 TRINITY_DN17234_c0_g1~~TRINITY_DN17234_c0_g1_i1.p1  ORF type:complete len:243 (+),score=13.97 TRINITY_DN17234_c0_g1_i1:497-1225(+)
MGSEGGIDAVRFNITGFGKFHGVADNPTEILVSKLGDYIREKGGPPILLESCTVLETAGKGALGRLLELLNGPLQSSALDTKARSEANGARVASRKILLEGAPRGATQGKIIWIHLGVNGGASRFALERRAYNEATFRCPDEAGWQPWKEPILPEDGPIDFFRQTVAPVDELVGALRKQGFDCAPSTDAGRFVCNYVYYHSLRHALIHGTESLFVHVPAFEVVGEDVQLEFVVALLRTLNSM